MASLTFFSPHSLAVGARERGCFTCDYFRGQWSGSQIICGRLEKDRVIGDPLMGCAH